MDFESIVAGGAALVADETAGRDSAAGDSVDTSAWGAGGAPGTSSGKVCRTVAIVHYKAVMFAAVDEAGSALLFLPIAALIAAANSAPKCTCNCCHETQFSVGVFSIWSMRSSSALTLRFSSLSPSFCTDA